MVREAVADGAGGGRGSMQWPVQWPVQRLVQTAHLDGPVGSGLRLHLAQRDVGVGGRLQRGWMDELDGWNDGMDG